MNRTPSGHFLGKSGFFPGSQGGKLAAGPFREKETKILAVSFLFFFKWSFRLD